MISKSFVVVKENNDSNWNILSTTSYEYNNKEEAINKYNEIKEKNPGTSKMVNGYIETYIALRIHDDEDNCDTDNILEMQVYNY